MTSRQAQRRYRAAMSLTEHVAGDILSCDHPDCPLGHLREAFVRLVHAEAEVERWAEAARVAGHSWTTIGAMLGISKQAARKRFG